MTAHQILNSEAWDELSAVMALDSHACYLPTHILRDETGAIAGAFSTVCAPVLFFWIQSTRDNAIAAAHAYALAEQEFRRQGHARILLFLEKKSPFYPYITKIGYTALGDVTAFNKELAN